MSAGHAHHHRGHDHAARSERRLALALALTGGFMLVEAAAALLTGSLALLSDAAHMFTDCAALAVSLAAAKLARMPGDAKRTFGYQRFEILAAAFNAVLLVLAAGYIGYQAFERLRAPAPIDLAGMAGVAALGLGVNLAAALLLKPQSAANLNVRGAYLEVLSDLVSSAGVILAALLIAATGALWIDAAVAVAICLWVLPRSFALLRASIHVLLEGVPEGINYGQVRDAILAVPGVASLHDLHVWSLASSATSLSVHVVVPDGARGEGAQRAIAEVLHERFRIHHSTIQVESSACGQDGAHCAP